MPQGDRRSEHEPCPLCGDDPTEGPHTACPTPAEIRERCLAIQATWSRAKRRARRGITRINAKGRVVGKAVLLAEEAIANLRWLPPRAGGEWGARNDWFLRNE